MRRRLLLPVIALALPLLFAPAVAASTGQVADSLGETIGWNVAISPTNLLAQTFTTPNKVERLDYIGIFFHGSTNGATVETWVKAGAPGTSGIAGTDVTGTISAGFTNNWIWLTPPTSITLAANTVYSVMFRVTDATNATTLAGENHAEYYPDGAAYGYNGSTWSTPAPGGSEDLSFQIFMSPLPSPTTDQHQNAHSTAVGFSVSAQTFTAGVTGTLDAVSLWSEGTNGNQSVTVEICTTTSGIDCVINPVVVTRPALDTGVLASTTVVVNHSDGQWNDFAFSPAPAIVAGTSYAIVVIGDAGWTGTASNLYASGQAYGYEAGWGTLNGAPVFDLAFQTFTTSSGATAPPTSTVGTTQTPGSPAPLPLLLALTAAISVSAIVLVKRYGIVARR
jgi:hypothetical protein